MKKTDKPFSEGQKIIVFATFEGSLEKMGLQGLVFRPYRMECREGITDRSPDQVAKQFTALLGVRFGITAGDRRGPAQNAFKLTVEKI